MTAASMAPFSKTRLGRAVYLLEFASQYELAATFLRVQEYYESREFHSKVFTLEDFMDWYVEEHGRFSYYEDWAGFNVPSTAFIPFYEGRFDPLTRKEKALLASFRRLHSNFYVIGTLADDSDATVQPHELAHALFHTDEDYRRAVTAVLADYELQPLEAELSTMGYCDDVHLDELQAYCVSGLADLGAKPTKVTKELERRVRELFEAHRDVLTPARSSPT